MSIGSRIPKPVLFGIVAAVAALLGGLLADPAFEALGGTSGGSNLVFSAETQRRLDREGARGGDVQIALSWNNKNDLDLHCMGPDEVEIWFRNRTSPTGGELDVDMNGFYQSGQETQISDEPVENVVWPEGAAPPGTYQVLVNHFQRQLGAADPTAYKVEIKRHGRVEVHEGVLSHGEEPDLITFELGDPPGTPLLAIVVWSSLVAVTISLALVIAQNVHLRRPFLQLAEARTAVLSAVVAGALAGGFAASFFDALGDADVVARLGGWTLLGLILGAGMSFFIPNLRTGPAATAGAVGGLLGAGAYSAFQATLGGSTAPTLLGLTILGFCIGLMVAWVEQAFREAWLEVHYGPGEMRRVSLGTKPVAIGSDARACAVFARGGPERDCSFRLVDGKILLREGAAGAETSVEPGHRRTIGRLEVQVCGQTGPVDTGSSLPSARSQTTGAAPAPTPTSHTGLRIRIDGGGTHPLGEGATLAEREVAGLRSTSPGGIVAEVRAHPQRPELLGLTNHSDREWRVDVERGDGQRVPPGRSVSLRTGIRIHFGRTSGEIVE